MSRIVIIGCGVVGAMIAYELSLVPGLTITVLDKHPPAQASTGAALGILMGIISHKVKGNAWKMREASIQRYEMLIPELEGLTGQQIPFNRQGILMLCLVGEDLTRWDQLIPIRHSQGWQLEMWDAGQVKSCCPQLSDQKIRAAVYSPQDRQVSPTALTLALVDAAQGNGVTFKFGVEAQLIASGEKSEVATPENQCIHQVKTTAGQLDCDWLVISAGLGSSGLTADLNQLIDIRPVLGQALHLQLRYPLGNPHFQPVVTGDGINIVPVGQLEYWVGATVEFPTVVDVKTRNFSSVPNAVLLEEVLQQAITFCPALATARILKTWSGLRPRPEGRPAPVIGQLRGYCNVLLATGHYRNGVLLAPATAQAIREAIVKD